MEKFNRVQQVGDIKALIQLLNGMKLEPLFEKIMHEIRSENRDAISYVKAIFMGSPVIGEKSAKRRLEIFKFCVGLLQVSSLQNDIASEILSILLVEIEVFPTSALVEISEYLVSDFKNIKKPEGKWLEILPRALSVLSARDTIVYGGLDMSGKDLKHMLVKSLCDEELNLSAVEMLTVVLKDVELSKDELELVVTKLLSVISHVSYQEMPTYIYQLILFSSKGHRKKILQNIVSYFMTEDNKVRDYENCESESLIAGPNVTLLRQTEGSVILLLKVGSRQDRGLGKDLVTMMKSIQHQPSLCLSPFVFSVALALVCIHRYEDEVLDILKGVTMRAFKQKEKALSSAWVRNILSDKEDIIALIKEAISNSTFGWDHMGQGLVKFGFLLLDTYGPKQICGRVPNRPHTPTISEHICALGCVILRDTFKAHRSVRSEIFEQILNRVITKTSVPVTHYIDVLSQTVQSDPQLLLEILSKLIEVLDYLPFLSYKNATDILKALTPLLKISMPLKDTLMLILRKALFHRNLEARKIAITGYMTILKRISAVGKISLSQSQSSLSSQASSCSMSSQVQKDCSFSATSKSESMCLEIMGILKRILMQQAEVKRLLYEGLYDVAVKNSTLVDIILELMLSQFEKFHNTTTDDDNSSSLDIHLCITTEKDKVVLQEPLAHLICAISLILHENKSTPTDEDDMDLEFEQSAQLMLENMLKALVTKMSKSDVELDTLDRFQELKDSLNEEKFKEHIVLLIGIYEVLMEYSFLNNKNYSVKECEEFLNLFQKYLDACEKLQRKKSGKSSKSKGGTFCMPDTLLTIRFFSVLIEALFAQNDEENEGLKLLRSDKDFVKHITHMCHQKLTLYSETGRSDGFSCYMENTHDYICAIANIYLRSYSSGLNSTFSSFQTWELSPVFIKGLSVIFSYMFSKNERQYQKLISELAKFIPSASDNGSTRVLKKFQKLTIKALADCENDEKLKEVVLLLSIISDLCTIPTNMVKDEVYQWMKQLTIEQTFENVPVAKKLVTLCLTLSNQQNDLPQVLREISFDIHYHLGDIDPETTVTGATNYSVVSAKTSPDLILVVVQHIEKFLEEIDWVLNIMKADAGLSNSSIQTTLGHEFGSFHEKEGSICVLLLDLLMVFKELLQAEIPVGNSSNAILKVSTNMYKCLTVMCKYYLLRYEQKNGYLHPFFPRVTKYSGINLNTPIYGFITYIQTKEMESVGNKKKSKSDTAGNVVREIKTIPSLVFAIEVYERHLILLSKKSKKNLMSHIKLSTARDFRIDPAALEAAINNQELSKESTLEETQLKEVEDNVTLINPTPTEEVPPTKKRKAT